MGQIKKKKKEKEEEKENNKEEIEEGKRIVSRWTFGQQNFSRGSAFSFILRTFTERTQEVSRILNIDIGN